MIYNRIHERLKALLSEVDTYIEEPSTFGTLDAHLVSAMHLIGLVFGEESHYYTSLNTWKDAEYARMDAQAEFLRTTLVHATKDVEAGLTSSLDVKITGDVMDDLLQLAKQTLRDDKKDVAAVLIAAALEDSLKRCARLNGLDVDDKALPQVISALKSEGVRVGGQKGLVRVLPEFRNAALHANWSDLEEADVASVIGFVEQFLARNF